MMSIAVSRMASDGLRTVGTLRRDGDDGEFAYDADYLTRPDATALSRSLPLRDAPFSEPELRPYFKGLLPEGAACELLAADLGCSSEDYLGILARAGLDCVGDVVFGDGTANQATAYQPLVFDELASLARRPHRIAEVVGSQRPSMAGVLNKVGLYHDSSESFDSGWYRPIGNAASNWLVKFARESAPYQMVNECLCMKTASHCALDVARTVLLPGCAAAICVERFDRIELSEVAVAGLPVPRRAHQEDLAQAFGVVPSRKYDELPGGTVRSIAQLIRLDSHRPVQDIRSFIDVLLFNYLIGNCDNHLKNLSIIYEGDRGSLFLAPFYDLMCTTAYGYSRDMGMAIGGVRCIDDVTAGDFATCATELGVSRKMVAQDAHRMADCIGSAMHQASEELAAEGFEDALVLAERFGEDMEPRRVVLASV